MDCKTERIIASALKIGLVNGFKKGLHGYLWIMKIQIPIALIVGLTEHFGWLARLDFLLQPAMAMLSLPPEAALPLLIGIMVGPAGCIGAMAVIPFTIPQITIMAVFCLTAHSMITECTIQNQSGYSSLKALILRLSSAVILAFIISLLVDSTTVVLNSIAIEGVKVDFITYMIGLFNNLLKLAFKLFFLIMLFICLLEICKSMKWIDPIVKTLTPALKLMGLSPKVGYIWVAAGIFGLVFGAAIIKEEFSSGNLSQDELNSVHASIAINHGLLSDDPVLFLALGVHPVFIWLPRLFMAMLLIRILFFFNRVFHKE